MNEQQPSRRRAAYVTLIGGYINIGVVIVQGLLLVPLYLSYIGPELYGAWLGSGDIIGWLAVLDMGLASQMIQRMGAAYGGRDRSLVAEYLATGVLVQLILVTFLFIGAIGVAGFIPGLMGIVGRNATILTGSVILAGLSTCFSILNNGVTGFAMALQRTIFMNVNAVAGSVLGIIATVLLLLSGWGLWAIALGWVIRDSIILGANSIYALFLYRSEINLPVRISRRVLRDFGAVSPAVFLSKLGSAFAGRSEAALIAILIRPELATVYVITRRAADIIRMMLDRFGAASFAGFANLIGTGQVSRANTIYSEIMHLFVPVAVLATSIYIAINQAFISLWVGPEMFGGQLLTTAIGLGTLVAAASSLAAYLYGATGRLAEISILVLTEGIVRIGLMVVLLQPLGLSGLPVSTILTGSAALFVTLALTKKVLGGWEKGFFSPVRLSLYSGLLVLASWMGNMDWADTWSTLILTSAATGLTFSVLITAIDPEFRIYVYSILGKAAHVVKCRLG